MNDLNFSSFFNIFLIKEIIIAANINPGATHIIVGTIKSNKSIIKDKIYKEDCTYIIEVTKDVLDNIKPIVTINNIEEKIIPKLN